MAADLPAADRALLSALQNEFPLVPDPFASLATRLGHVESEVLARTAALKAQGPLRQIGAIFDTRRLGYASTLVAFEVEPARLDEVGQAVSRHPGVSHCYSRDHTLNLWFTLAVPPGRDLAAEVQSLSCLPGTLRTLDLPVVRAFKIDVRLDLGAAVLAQGADGRAQAGGAPASPLQDAVSSFAGGEPKPLEADDIPYVRALQEDLPLVSRPFAALAARFQLPEGDLLAAGRRLLAAGTMRRYGATLRHREAGYRANAMACWMAPHERIVAAGQAAAAHHAVSHCYERPAQLPEWPYQLYTMVHAHSEEKLAAAIGELEGLIRPLKRAVLPTLKEYKKARLRYFDEP